MGLILYLLGRMTPMSRENRYLLLSKTKAFKAIVSSLPNRSAVPCFGVYGSSDRLFDMLSQRLKDNPPGSEDAFYVFLFETAKEYGLMKQRFRGGRSLLTLLSVFFCVSALIVTPLTVNYVMPILKNAFTAATASALTALLCILGVAMAVTLICGAVELFFSVRHSGMTLNALWSKKKEIDDLLDQSLSDWFQEGKSNFSTIYTTQREYKRNNEKQFKGVVGLGFNYGPKAADSYAASEKAKRPKEEKGGGYVTFAELTQETASAGSFQNTPMKTGSQ